MSNQLKAFLCSLLCQLVDYRTQPRDLRGHFHDWAKWGRISGRIDLACELGLLIHDQWVDLHRLLSSASDCLGKPFPHPANAGPVIPHRVLHERRQAAAVDTNPRVIYMGSYDFVDASQVKPQAQDSANEKPEPVPAPAAPRELRLLCVLDVLSPIERPRYIPAGTMHRLSPRASVQGRWSLEGDAFYQLRSAHPKRPTAKVLVRCERHRQANAVCSIARTI